MMLTTYHTVDGQMKIDIYNHFAICGSIHKQWTAVSEKYNASGFNYRSRGLSFEKAIPHGFRKNGLPNKKTLIGKQAFSELAALPDYLQQRDILIKLGANNTILNPMGNRTYIEYPHVFNFKQSNILVIMLIGDDCPLRKCLGVEEIKKWEFEKLLAEENEIREKFSAEVA